jgi:hypothetical protein
MESQHEVYKIPSSTLQIWLKSVIQFYKLKPESEGRIMIMTLTM